MKATNSTQALLLFFFTILAIGMQVQPAAADAGDVIAGLLGACKFNHLFFSFLDSLLPLYLLDYPLSS